MKYSESKQGRVFIIRLEDGDIIHDTLEGFARDQNIRAASIIILGGADMGSKLVVGPEDGRAEDIVPMVHVLHGVSETAGVGTIFPNTEGEPVLHMHISCGRETSSVTGCVRRGVRVWHVMEVIIRELVSSKAVRAPDSATGFELLQP